MHFSKVFPALILTLAISAGAVPSHAATVPIAPVGATDVRVTAPLGALGLSAGLFGDAFLVSADPLTVGFPITGGTIDTDAGTASIEHENSGVTLLTADPADDVEATVGNFVVDTAAGEVRGDILGGPENVTFFLFGAVNSEIELLISADLAAALTTVFGADDLEGEQFGFASSSPQPVPLPAALPLFVGGLVWLGALARSRRRS